VQVAVVTLCCGAQLGVPTHEPCSNLQCEPCSGAAAQEAARRGHAQRRALRRSRRQILQPGAAVPS
jgi:hypothetical protein